MGFMYSGWDQVEDLLQLQLQLHPQRPRHRRAADAKTPHPVGPILMVKAATSTNARTSAQRAVVREVAGGMATGVPSLTGQTARGAPLWTHVAHVAVVPAMLSFKC